MNLSNALISFAKSWVEILTAFSFKRVASAA